MNSPSDVFGGGRRLAVLVGVCAAATLVAHGCRGCGNSSSPPADPTQIRVDEPDLDYVYRARDGRLVTAASLSQIPETLRGAIMVHHPTMTGSRRDADRIYVANLLEASPGATVEARPSTREAFAARSADLREARQTAELVAFATIELTQLHTDSDRRAASAEAREIFNDILPRLRSPDASSAPEPDTRPSPDPTKP